METERKGEFSIQGEPFPGLRSNSKFTPGLEDELKQTNKKPTSIHLFH